MAKVVIYTSAHCPYCKRAKDLLTQKGAEFEEISIDDNDDLRNEMVEKTNRQTVPQIFINDQHIGGSDDLYALEKAGKLTDMLA